MDRIGYVIPEFPGQTHTWIWRELCHLREWGVAVTIFSTRRPDPAMRAAHAFVAEAERETIFVWPPRLVPAATALLWAVVSHPMGLLRCIRLGLTLPVDERPAVRTVLPLLVPACVLAREAARRGLERLHAHTCANGAILCMMARRLIGIPFSMTLNAQLPIWGGAMAQKFADAQFTIAITQWLLDDVKRECPHLGPDQVMLGRIGVDTRKWAPAAERAAPAAGPLRLLTVARLHWAKGHTYLLRATKQLVDAGMDVTLRIAGNGAERERLEALTAELRLGERVQFLGPLPEDAVIRELSETDVFVLASDAEPLGVAYMEAMAMAVPTLGTAAGGVAEIITDGIDGVLVPPKDPAALADALRALIADPERRQCIGQAGRETIVRRFDSRLGAATLYEHLFHRPPRVSPEAPTSTPAHVSCDQAKVGPDWDELIGEGLAH
ncbi:MAG TPA: glycosyltransferase [Tepidisphaeraceae bacterium]